MVDLETGAEMEAASARAEEARVASEAAEANAAVARREVERVRYEAEVSKRCAEVARAEANTKAVEGEVVRAEIRLARAERAAECAKDKMQLMLRALERADAAVLAARRAANSTTDVLNNDCVDLVLQENARISKVETDALIGAANAARAESLASTNDSKIEQAELETARAELNAARAKLTFAKSVANFARLHVQATKKSPDSNVIVSLSHFNVNGTTQSSLSSGNTLPNRSLSEIAKTVKPAIVQNSRVEASTSSVRVDASIVKKTVPVNALSNNRIKSEETKQFLTEYAPKCISSLENEPINVNNNTSAPTSKAPSKPASAVRPSDVNPFAKKIEPSKHTASVAKDISNHKKPLGRRSHAIPIVNPNDVSNGPSSSVPSVTVKPNVNEKSNVPSSAIVEPVVIRDGGNTKLAKKGNKNNSGSQAPKVRYCAQCGVQEQPKIPKKGFYRGPTGNRTLCLSCNLKWLQERKAENLAKEEAEEAKKTAASLLNASAASFTPGVPLAMETVIAATSATAAASGGSSLNRKPVKENGVKTEKTVVVPNTPPVKHSAQDHRQNLMPKPNNSNNPTAVPNHARLGNRGGTPTFDGRTMNRARPAGPKNLGVNPFASPGLSTGEHRARGSYVGPKGNSMVRDANTQLDPTAANRRAGRIAAYGGGNIQGLRDPHANGSGAYDNGYRYQPYDNRRNPIGTGYSPYKQDFYGTQVKPEDAQDNYYEEGYASSNGDFRSTSGYAESNWDVSNKHNRY